MADRLEGTLRDLEKGRAEIADAYRELERFTTATAHDLQEPIRKVQTYGSLLGRSADDLDDLGRSRLERLLAASSELADLTTALSVYTQVLRFDEPPEPVHLGELVDWCVARRAEELVERSCSVDHFDLSVVHAPPSALALIFDELLANAIRFSRTGTPLTMQVWQEEHHDFVRISFADNGQGFDSRYEERIFEPFERLHAKGIHPGTGMGLAIARRYARTIGGDLTASSSPAGATFFIDLPGVATETKPST